MEIFRRQRDGLKEKNVKALKAHIKAFFEKHDHQEKVIIDLYRMVLSDWDKIKTIKGHPETGDELWKFICRQFQIFDLEYHPDCLAGGAWMNWGFSVNRKLGPWDISLSSCTITYQP